MDTLSKYPWQTDTSIGDWFYRTGQNYKSATEIIQMLVDIVQQKRNLLLMWYKRQKEIRTGYASYSKWH